LLKHPSGFLPVLMSLAALAVVLTFVVLHGTAPQADEGLAAHLWQVLMAGQIPLVVFFAIKWLPQSPGQVIRVIALQIGAALAAPVVLPIAPQLRDVLHECRRRAVMSEYVLITPEGRPYSKTTVNRYLNIAKQIVCITRPFRFHDQRHTFASILATSGINAFTLRDLLGHTSTRTTVRYARPSSETFAAVERALA